jgi:hypothetical protein
MVWWLVDGLLDGDRKPLVVVAVLIAALVALVVMYR